MINKRRLAIVRRAKKAGMTKDQITTKVTESMADAAQREKWLRSEHAMALMEWTQMIDHVYGRDPYLGERAREPRKGLKVRSK